MTRLLAATLAVITTAFTLCAGAQTPAAAPPAAAALQMLMTTPAFEDGGVLPPKYAGGATAVSPALSWSQVLPGTQSFVVLMHDLEPAQNKTSKMDITHWLAWNIPGTSTGLAEGVPAGALPDGTQQISIRTNGYFGPGAGPGKYHHYVFELYALDVKLTVAPAQPEQVVETRRAVFDAMDGHVLGKAVLVSRFHR